MSDKERRPSKKSKMKENKKHPYKKKRKIVLALVLSIFLLNIVSSLQVDIDSKDIDIQYNIRKQIPITIINDKTYPIYDIDVEGEYVSMDIITELNVGETINSTLYIQTNEIGEFSNPITFISFAKTDCTVFSGTHHNIKITEEGLVPDIRICVGDRLDFHNLLTSIVSLNLAGETDGCIGGKLLELKPNGSSTGNEFSDINQEFISMCAPHMLDILISVHNDTILTHSTSDDFSLTLIINSILEETNLIIFSITSTNYDTDYDVIESGSMIIKNNGTEEAVNVKLEGDWFIFDENNFNILSGKTNSVDFSIYPDISSASQTNKTYTKTIKIKADNSEEITQEVSIFIKYSEVIAEEGDLAYLKYLNDVFCIARPYSFLCEQQPRIVTKEVPKYNCPKILAEMTAEDVLKLIQANINAPKEATQVYNLLKIYADEQNRTMSEIFAELNISSAIQQEQKENIEESTALNMILFFGAIFVVIIGFGVFLLYKFVYLKKKEKEHL